MSNLRENRKTRKNRKLQAIPETPEQSAKAKLLQFSQNQTLAFNQLSPDFDRMFEQKQIQSYPLNNIKKLNPMQTHLQNYQNYASFYHQSETSQNQSTRNHRNNSFNVSNTQRYLRVVMKSPLTVSNYLMLGSSRTQTQSSSVEQKKHRFSISIKNTQRKLTPNPLSQNASNAKNEVNYKKRNIRLRKMFPQSEKPGVEEGSFNDERFVPKKGARIKFTDGNEGKVERTWRPRTHQFSDLNK